ncbi:NUDIX hydrolase [Natronoglycomyces albus]|uniref:NUDIX hydrolase n=2 Tax=Natronoglycomyces albus TaxID=2811108 RepID=A0A895XPE3_9ACTN|nr:NUDIX hydrolase [Natronoglycomyces albus]
MSDGTVHQREYFQDQGAVAIVAVDDHERVMLIRQYRHPARQRLWEIPAGLRDVAGESPDLTARRELAEETDLRAARWDYLGSFYNSPGISDEQVMYYLARDLSTVPDAQRYERKEEEAEMELRFWELDKALAALDSGEIVNGVCALGLFLATRRLRLG